MPEWAKDFPHDIIRAEAEKLQIDEHVLYGLIMSESSGNTNAIRYEPNWRYFKDVGLFARSLRCTPQTEQVGQATSWGLMQVMGTVAREHGFRGWFPELCNSETGIHYGSLHFKKKLKRYPTISDAISAYNQGAPFRRKGGDYINQAYVDRVSYYMYSMKQYLVG